MEKLNILYEDNHIIVCVKPRGVLSQADSSNAPDMLTIIKAYIKEKYQKPGNVYLGLVMRLDRNTSGVMVFAKTSKAASRLCKDISEHLVKKEYLCVAEGELKEPKTLKDYLIKDEKIVKSFCTDESKGKEAILEFTPISSFLDRTLLKINLLTGRHHQIRCQLANYHHPLRGDHLYGSKVNEPYLLHAFKLSFIHPISKERLTFVSFPNKDGWESYTDAFKLIKE